MEATSHISAYPYSMGWDLLVGLTIVLVNIVLAGIQGSNQSEAAAVGPGVIRVQVQLLS